MAGGNIIIHVLDIATFTNVRAGQEGGAIYTINSGTATVRIDNTDLINVYATLGGGFAYISGSTLTLTSVDLTTNNVRSTSNSGGAFLFNAHTAT